MFVTNKGQIIMFKKNRRLKVPYLPVTVFDPIIVDSLNSPPPSPRLPPSSVALKFELSPIKTKKAWDKNKDTSLINNFSNILANCLITPPQDIRVIKTLLKRMFEQQCFDGKILKSFLDFCLTNHSTRLGDGFKIRDEQFKTGSTLVDLIKNTCANIDQRDRCNVTLTITIDDQRCVISNLKIKVRYSDTDLIETKDATMTYSSVKSEQSEKKRTNNFIQF